MWTTKTKTKAVAALTAMAMAATAAMPIPAAAAPAARAVTAQLKAQVKADDGSTDFSGARRYRRGGNAAALAMFGAVAGTIATIAIAEQRRKRERDYWRARHGYGSYGQPGYYPGYAPHGYFYAPGGYAFPAGPSYPRPGRGYYGYPY